MGYIEITMFSLSTTKKYGDRAIPCFNIKMSKEDV